MIFLMIMFVIFVAMAVLLYINAVRSPADDFGTGILCWLFGFLAVVDLIIIAVVYLIRRFA